MTRLRRALRGPSAVSKSVSNILKRFKKKLPRHRLYGKEDIYSGRPPSSLRTNGLRRTRFCRQNEQRSSYSLVAEDRKTASFDANRIK